MTHKLMILLAMASLLSCRTMQDLPTVEKVDLNQYAGLWYEIARLPNSFEKGLECVTAQYAPDSKGKIEVLNRGYSSEKGTYKTARGTARVPDLAYPGRLKVTFFWPFAGNYYIIDLDEQYRHALVGDPSRKYLWVLSRTRTMEAAVYDALLDKAESHGFETGQVIKINQSCE